MFPAIVKAVNFSMFIADSDLNHKVLFSEMLAAKNIGDKVNYITLKIKNYSDSFF